LLKIPNLRAVIEEVFSGVAVIVAIAGITNSIFVFVPLLWVRKIRAKICTVTDPIAVAVTENVCGTGVTGIPHAILVEISLGRILMLRAVVHRHTNPIAILVAPGLFRAGVAGIPQAVAVTITQLQCIEIGT